MPSRRACGCAQIEAHPSARSEGPRPNPPSSMRRFSLNPVCPPRPCCVCALHDRSDFFYAILFGTLTEQVQAGHESKNVSTPLAKRQLAKRHEQAGSRANLPETRRTRDTKHAFTKSRCPTLVAHESHFAFWNFLPVAEWRVQVSHLDGLVFGQMISQLRKRLSTGKIGEAANFALETYHGVRSAVARLVRGGIRVLPGFGCCRDSETDGRFLPPLTRRATGGERAGPRGGSETAPYFFGHARGMPWAVRADWNSARSAGVAWTARGEVFFARQKTARAPTDSPMFHSTGCRR
jgi:hypothetical protein